MIPRAEVTDSNDYNHLEIPNSDLRTSDFPFDSQYYHCLESEAEQAEKLAMTRMLQTNFLQLAAHGFNRDPWEYEFIVTYPPLPALGEGESSFVLNRNNEKSEVSIYVHLPFCTKICTFCGRFIKYSNKSIDSKYEYLSYLKREIELWLRVLESDEFSVISLYFGGGTPTALDPDALYDLITGIKKSFGIKSGIEITVETSPEVTSGETLESLKAADVSRLSIGVQSLDDETLKLCNRSHNSYNAISSFYKARELGFDNICIDLISGLPTYDIKKYLRDLQILSNLKPECITIYPLYIQSSSLMSRLDRSLFPSQDEIRLFGLTERYYFSQLGYSEGPIHYYVSSMEKAPSQWNHRWKKSGQLIGLGVSSYGYFNSTQYHNHLRLRDYFQEIDKGHLPIWRFSTLNSEEETRRKIIFQIKSGKISKTIVPPKFARIIDNLQRLGLIEDGVSELSLTDIGRLYSEEICLLFYSTSVKTRISELGFRYSGYMNKPSLYYTK